MFIFDVTNIIDYNEYLDFITSLKADFDNKRAALFEKYNITDSADQNNCSEKYFVFRDSYRQLRQNVVTETIKRFRSFLPEKCLIYEFGSLVKQTDRIESDIDLTFCYDDEKLDIYENAEELIDYSLSYVFETTIDHVHGKFQHYPMMHEFDGLTEENNIYMLRFNNGTIKYSCGAETLSENLMNIKNVRDYKSLINGYAEKYALRCNIDCLYSILVIENTIGHDFIGDLAELENNNNIFADYNYSPRQYVFEEETEVSLIKKALKNTVVAMYIMISYSRKKVNWLEQYSMTMDDVFSNMKLKAFFGDEYIQALKDAFIRMTFYWDKTELLLKENDVKLSTRCYKIYNKNELDMMLSEKYHEQNLMDKMLSSINTLNDIVTEGWRMLNEQ